MPFISQIATSPLALRQAKTRRRKTVTLKRGNAPKAVRRRSSSAAGLQEQLDRRTQELTEALAQQTAGVPPLYPLTRAHEGRAGMSAVDSATCWGRLLAAVADSILVFHRALPDLQRMKHKPDQAFGHREECFVSS